MIFRSHDGDGSGPTVRWRMRNMCGTICCRVQLSIKICIKRSSISRSKSGGSSGINHMLPWCSQGNPTNSEKDQPTKRIFQINCLQLSASLCYFFLACWRNSLESQCMKSEMKGGACLIAPPQSHIRLFVNLLADASAKACSDRTSFGIDGESTVHCKMC